MVKIILDRKQSPTGDQISIIDNEGKLIRTNQIDSLPKKDDILIWDTKESKTDMISNAKQNEMWHLEEKAGKGELPVEEHNRLCELRKELIPKKPEIYKKEFILTVKTEGKFLFITTKKSFQGQIEDGWLNCEVLLSPKVDFDIEKGDKVKVTIEKIENV